MREVPSEVYLAGLIAEGEAKNVIEPGSPAGSDNDTDGTAYPLDTDRSALGEEVTVCHKKGDTAKVKASDADAEKECTLSGTK